jgi:hypothetical protein
MLSKSMETSTIPLPLMIRSSNLLLKNYPMKSYYPVWVTSRIWFGPSFGIPHKKQKPQNFSHLISLNLIELEIMYHERVILGSSEPKMTL